MYPNSSTDEPDLVKIQSSVSTALLTRTLFQGSLLAGIGASLLLFSGIFFPPNQLKFWGFPIFLISIVLIAWGLIPYRLLKRLENNPSTLILENDAWIHFIAKEKLLFSIPVQSIDKIKWIENNAIYGIKMNLKKAPSGQVIIRNKNFNFEQFRRRCQKKYESDLFFAYFNKKAFERLQSRLQDIMHLN